ncbi:hypothetical protein [Streptomyces sp. NPDC058964]|uniref:hypothetical protein n=1 Tax=Streptomyces sp. NPDC058964 TaxID=3346681 RepID=UPI0036B07C35
MNGPTTDGGEDTVRRYQASRARADVHSRAKAHDDRGGPTEEGLLFGRAPRNVPRPQTPDGLGQGRTREPDRGRVFHVEPREQHPVRPASLII